MRSISTLFPSLALALLGLGRLTGAAAAQTAVPFDNQKGRYMSFETAPLEPMLLSKDGAQLFALSAASNRLVIYDTASWQCVNEIALGLGPASMAERPGSRELWVVDRIGSCVSVVATDHGNIERTVRVGGEPYGIAFSDEGDRAYVTCSASDRVDVIRTSDYTLVQSIAIPARNPRGIVYHGGAAHVVSFLSGNGTAPRGTALDPDDIRTVERVQGPGLAPLPDRDLFVVRRGAQAGQDVLDVGATRSGLGTMLLNLHLRPHTDELWIPNTDALNAEHVGERSFVEGQVVRNRITILSSSSAAAPRVIDLDQIAPPGVRCAQPTGIAFDPVRPQAYVCGYGSDLVAVLGLRGGGQVIWMGAIRIPPRLDYPRGSGPRTCLVDPHGEWLYIYEMGDNAITRVSLTSMPGVGIPFEMGSAPGIPVGFTLLSGGERFGRHLFNNANFSKSLTSSCASCHVDGNTDGLAWDLSLYLDPEGTPPSQLSFGLDLKGPLVTQGVRRLEEIGPYHWRGERRELDEFNAAFASLLDHEINGLPEDIGPDFGYVDHYVNRINIPANTRENLDRSLTPLQQQGATLFQSKPVLKGLSCADCHSLPLGTSGVVLTENPGTLIRTADVPALRGVGDKLAPPQSIGAGFGRRTELGAGLGHGGAFASLVDFALQRRHDGSGQQLFDLSRAEALAIEAFLLAFDTGLAPATGFQITAYPANAASVEANELPFLIDQVLRGNCDLVAIRTPSSTNGNFQVQTCAFDPQSGGFRTALQGRLPLSIHQLILEAQLGKPVTFLGLPVDVGRAYALDRDMDGAWDLDEQRLGMDPERGNMDLDMYPDGYELRWGMNPFVADYTSPDHRAPSLVGSARLIYATTNTLKFEIDTDEVCQLQVAYNGGYPVNRLPLSAHKDTRFSVVLNDLQPDTDYNLSLRLRDAANNVAYDTTQVLHTRPRPTALPVHIESIALGVVQDDSTLLPPRPPYAQATVELRQARTRARAGYVVHGALYHLSWNGALLLVQPAASGVTGADGRATLPLSLAPGPGPGLGTLIFTVSSIDAPTGAVEHARAGDRVTNAAATY